MAALYKEVKTFNETVGQKNTPLTLSTAVLSKGSQQVDTCTQSSTKKKERLMFI